VRTDFESYRRHSRLAWDWIKHQVDCVEQVGIDEGYLELTTANDGESFEALLTDLQRGCSMRRPERLNRLVATSKTVGQDRF